MNRELSPLGKAVHQTQWVVILGVDLGTSDLVCPLSKWETALAVRQDKIGNEVYLHVG